MVRYFAGGPHLGLCHFSHDQIGVMGVGENSEVGALLLLSQDVHAVTMTLALSTSLSGSATCPL